MSARLDPQRLKAANINPATGLATDYLNHYNEIAMMIGCLEETPEFREAVLDWRPMGYAAHFRLTGFRERDLAIAAYEAAPDGVKQRFLTARRQLDLAIADVQDLIEAAPDTAASLARHAPSIFAAIASLGAVINSGQEAAPAGNDAQAAADSLFS